MKPWPLPSSCKMEREVNNVLYQNVQHSAVKEQICQIISFFKDIHRLHTVFDRYTSAEIIVLENHYNQNPNLLTMNSPVCIPVLGVPYTTNTLVCVV